MRWIGYASSIELIGQEYAMTGMKNLNATGLLIKEVKPREMVGMGVEADSRVESKAMLLLGRLRYLRFTGFGRPVMTPLWEWGKSGEPAAELVHHLLDVALPVPVSIMSTVSKP